MHFRGGANVHTSHHLLANSVEGQFFDSRTKLSSEKCNNSNKKLCPSKVPLPMGMSREGCWLFELKHTSTLMYNNFIEI